MSVVKQVIRMYMNGIPYRDIAEAVTINKETVVNYIKRAKLSGKDLNQLLAMEDSVLEALLRGGKAAYPDDRFVQFKELLPYFESELKRHGVTRKLLWEEYRKDNPNGYGLTQFNEHIRQEIKAGTGLSNTTITATMAFFTLSTRTVTLTYSDEPAE